MKMKFVVEKIFYVLMVLSLLLVFAFLGSILITIIKNGWPAMSWDMVTKLPGGGFYIGKEGGVLNAIVGSVYIVGASTVLGLCISIPIVFFVNIYLKKDSKLANLTRLSFDVLYGIRVWCICIYDYDFFRITNLFVGRYYCNNIVDYSYICPVDG